MAKKPKKPKHGGARAGAGRPKSENALPRKTIRCEEERWERYRQAAEAEGLSLSEWLRLHADRAAEKTLGKE